MNRLIELYKKTNGGHTRLTESDFNEYAKLRKEEFQTRRAELEALGCTNINPVKDTAGDIIGCTWTEPNL